MYIILDNIKNIITIYVFHYVEKRILTSLLQSKQLLQNYKAQKRQP